MGRTAIRSCINIRNPLVKAGRVSAVLRMPENTVRSAGSPNLRITLAGPAPAERRARESSAPSVADRFNLSGVNYEKEKCM